MPGETEIAAFREFRSKESPADLHEAAVALPPDSFVRHYFLGKAAFHESRFPEAIRHLREARRLIESGAGFAGEPASGDPAHWHSLVLYWLALYSISAGHIDAQLEALQAYRERGYDRYEEMNEIAPPAIYWEVYGLCKAGRPDQAAALFEEVSRRDAAGESRLSPAILEEMDLWVRNFRERNDEILFENYRDLIRNAAGPRAGDLVWLARYARRNGAWDEARGALREAASLIDEKSRAHPHRVLAEIDISEGSWEQADRQILECWKSLAAKGAFLRQELEKETRLTLATSYLARGMSGDAWRILEPLADTPVRGGLRFHRWEQADAGFCVAAIAALRQTIRLPADLDPGEWRDRLSLRLRKAGLERRLRKRIATLMSENAVAASFEDHLQCPRWLWGEAFRCLGPAISSRLVDTLPPTGRQAETLLAAARSEIAMLRGDAASAISYCDQALDTLPPEETLLRARLLTVRAAALADEGRLEESLSGWTAALSACPSMIPLSGHSLPVTANRDSPATAQLFRDPRLRRTGWGLRIACEQSDGALAVVLSVADGAVLASSRLGLGDGRRPLPVMTEALNGLFRSGPALSREQLFKLEGYGIDEDPDAEPGSLDRLLQRYVP